MDNSVIHVRNDLNPESLPNTTPQKVLKSLPRGIYTTFSVENGYLVKDWDVHILRLCKSLPAQHVTLNDAFDSYKSWLLSTHAIAFTDAELTDSKHREILEKLLLPPIISALNTQKTIESTATQQLLVCVAITPATTSTPTLPPIDIHVLCSVYHQPPLPSPLPSSHIAVILGGPRKVPTAKDTGWIAERATLEAMKAPGVSDILLCDQQGRLLEGLITNVFIVTKSKDAAAYIIETAGTEVGEEGGGGVAWGTVRWRVKQAADKLGIQFIEQAPSMGDRDMWKEAFLSNSLRGIEPLWEIKCDERNVFGHESFEVKFGSTEVGRRIQQAVLGLTGVVDLRKHYR